MINLKNIYYYLGNAISQLITLLTAIYILKNIEPSIFGHFSIFIAIGSVIGSLATLKYELSISMSKDEPEMYNKFNFTVFLSFFVNIILVFLVSPFFNLFNLKDLALLILFANSISINGSLQQVFLYKEDHIKNGLLALSVSCINYVLIVYILKGDSKLIVSNVASYIVSSIIFIVFLRKAVLSFNLKSAYKEIFLKHLDFPKYILPGAISTIVLAYCHPIFLSYIYDKETVGLFSFALRILLLPTIVVGSVASGLLRAKISKLFFERLFDEIYEEVVKMIKWLALACIGCYSVLLIIIFNLKYIIDISKWNGIEMASLFMVFYCISQFFYIPLSNVAMVFGKNKLLMNLNLIQLVITILCYLFAFIQKVSFLSFLLILSVALFTFAIYSCICFLKLVKNSQSK